jgi:regulatory protein
MSGEALTLEAVKAERDRLSVTFSGGAVFELGTAYLPPEYSGAFLYPGAVITAEAEAALRRAAECLAVEKAALRLVTRAEQCAKGLERKLRQRAYSSGAIRAVLDRMLELNLVNDSRYAELWLTYRVRRDSKGPWALGAALRSKGIDRDTADRAFRSVLTPEAEAALLERCLEKAALKKKPERAGHGYHAAAEQKFFLKSEGFSQAAIEIYFEERE